MFYDHKFFCFLLFPIIAKQHIELTLYLWENFAAPRGNKNSP